MANGKESSISDRNDRYEVTRLFFRSSVVRLHSLMDHMDKSMEKIPSFNSFPLVLILRKMNM